MPKLVEETDFVLIQTNQEKTGERIEHAKREARKQGHQELADKDQRDKDCSNPGELYAVPTKLRCLGAGCITA
jgi:hypothetical protein